MVYLLLQVAGQLQALANRITQTFLSSGILNKSRSSVPGLICARGRQVHGLLKLRPSCLQENKHILCAVEMTSPLQSFQYAEVLHVFSNLVHVLAF